MWFHGLFDFISLLWQLFDTVNIKFLFNTIPLYYKYILVIYLCPSSLLAYDAISRQYEYIGTLFSVSAWCTISLYYDAINRQYHSSYSWITTFSFPSWCSIFMYDVPSQVLLTWQMHNVSWLLKFAIISDHPSCSVSCHHLWPNCLLCGLPSSLIKLSTL